MLSKIKNIFFRDTAIQTFAITRLHDSEIEEEVFLKQDKQRINVTPHQGMICLDPFCIAVWLSADELRLIDPKTTEIQFVKGKKLNAALKTSLIEVVPTSLGSLLLYEIKGVKNYQLNALSRLILFAHYLKSKKNTYYSRKVISALYSYPRRIIIVSYQDDDYYNIFPMDIQGYIKEDDLYVLGLRTTNITLEKILAAKKIVICDSNEIDVNTVYNLGKHSSSAPTPKDQLPFRTSPSEVLGFPIPDFSGSYKEVEIIYNRKMGYHMLMVGKVVNSKELKPGHTSLFHVGFLQYLTGNYKRIEGLF
jgi:hypothetical protein